MTDIHDIERLFYFLPYLRTDTWYVVAACIGVYAIHIFYLALAERHRKYRERMAKLGLWDDPYEIARKALDAIDPEGKEFFAEIGLLVRTYLERSGRIEHAVKKTTEEVLRDLPSDPLRTLLETCSAYEYAPSGHSDRPSRESIRSLAREIIEEIHDTQLTAQ